MPKSFEDSIVDTQVENQKVTLQKFDQQAELVRQSSQVILSEAEKKIAIINAEANAEAYTRKQASQVVS